MKKCPRIEFKISLRSSHHGSNVLPYYFSFTSFANYISSIFRIFDTVPSIFAWNYKFYYSIHQIAFIPFFYHRFPYSNSSICSARYLFKPHPILQIFHNTIIFRIRVGLILESSNKFFYHLMF